MGVSTRPRQLGRQAGARVRRVAGERGRIEHALARVLDQSIFQSVAGIARRDGCPGHRRERGRIEDRGTIRAMRRRPGPHEAKRLADSIVGGRAGNDAVVVFGETLRFRQCLVPAARAADEVRLLGKLPRRGPHDQLRGVRHHVDRTPAKVEHFFGMAFAENHVVAGVPGIGARGGISAAKGAGHRGVRDRSLVAAVAHALELAVPRGAAWDPHLELDF